MPHPSKATAALATRFHDRLTGSEFPAPFRQEIWAENPDFQPFPASLFL